MSIRNAFCALVATTALLAASAAYAEGPAVSEVNGKLSFEGGASGSNKTKSGGVGQTLGSLTIPLGQSFGLQFDGAMVNSHNRYFGGGDAQLFWRDPQLGLLGAFASVGGGRGITLSWYGGKAEYYAGPVTLKADAGYQVVYNYSAANGAFGIGNLTYYLTPDFALTLGGGSVVKSSFVEMTLEYQPVLNGHRNMSFFVESNVGNNAAYSSKAGVRFYFGPEKTLIRRHREDDPNGVIKGALLIAPFRTPCVRYVGQCVVQGVNLFQDF